MSTPRRLKLGLLLPQTEGMRGVGVRGWSEVSAMARVAEDVGFDSLWLVDHLSYKLDGEEKARGTWEVWSMLSALAATTRRVELGTLVLAIGWRNPALLAKMVDAVEEISGGRLILGLGSGYHKFEYDAFGFPFDYKVSRFEEAIRILHGLLRTGHVDFAGRFYSARDCELVPRGPRPAGPPILMGTVKPRMMACMAKYADLWNAYYDDTHNKVAGIRRLRPIVDEACRKEGRDPATLERTVTALIADPKADPWWDRLPTENWVEDGPLKPLSGPAETIAQALLEYHAAGITHLQICLEPTTCASIETLAPVLGLVREATGG
ncbi:MAG: LLM class flavin-dependent oxidoreductase [Gammaproteobacteria bacterium]|nr:LLM class flavin-dependent oxidoreductase [Gammaproteobacteria bacterium]